MPQHTKLLYYEVTQQGTINMLRYKLFRDF